MNHESPIIPQTSPGHYSALYEYDYFFDFEDKVLYTKADPKETAKLLCHFDYRREIDKPSTKGLAGDLKEEYSSAPPLGYVIGLLKQQISVALNREVIDVSLVKKRGGEGQDIWVNYQKQYEYSPLHNHGGVYSFVWYLDIPEEIRREWEPQSKVSRAATRGCIAFSSLRTAQKLTFMPRTSDMLLFSAKHQHQVYPFFTNNTRVSMAGNIHSITLENGEVITEK